MTSNIASHINLKSLIDVIDPGYSVIGQHTPSISYNETPETYCHIMIYFASWLSTVICTFDSASDSGHSTISALCNLSSFAAVDELEILAIYRTKSLDLNEDWSQMHVPAARMSPPSTLHILSRFTRYILGSATIGSATSYSKYCARRILRCEFSPNGGQMSHFLMRGFKVKSVSLARRYESIA